MFMKPWQVEHTKQSYPKGTRVRLEIDMAGEQGMPGGLEGTVEMVDDAGQLLMKWDNGRTLSLIPGEDSFSVLSRPEQAQETAQAPAEPKLEL